MVRRLHHLVVFCILTLTSCYYLTPSNQLHKQLNREAISYLERARMEMDEFTTDQSIHDEISQYMAEGAIPDPFYQKLRIKKFSSFLFVKNDLLYWSDEYFPQEYLEEIYNLDNVKGLYNSDDEYISYRKERIDSSTTLLCLFNINNLVKGHLENIEQFQITSLNPSSENADLSYDDLQFTVVKSNIVESKIRLLFVLSLFLWMGALIISNKHIAKILQLGHYRRGYGLWIAGLVFFLVTYIFVVANIWNQVPLDPNLKWIWGGVLLFIWNAILAIQITPDPIFSTQKKIGKYIFTLLTYTIILLSFLFIARFFKHLVFQTEVQLNFESFYFFDPSSLISLTSVILISISFFLLHFKLLNNIPQFQLPIRDRLGQFILASMITSPILLFSNLEFAIFPFLIVCAIYLILFELFIESREKSITWIVTWLILFSGFSAIILFKYNWKKELQFRNQLAREIPLDQPLYHPDYQIGIYSKGKLINTNAQEQFPKQLPEIYTTNSSEEIIQNGYSSVVHTKQDLQVVVNKKLTGMIKPISLFSYIFGLFLILAIIFALVNTFYPFLPFQLNLKIANTKSLRTRIQLSVISTILASFVIIAIITVFYFKNSAEDNQINQMRSKLNAIVQTLDIQAYMRSYPWVYSGDLKSELENMSIINDVKIELYDIHGQLVNEIKSPHDSQFGTEVQRLPIKTLGELKNGKNLLFDQKEVASDRQLISYASIKNSQQMILGFIAIPDMTLSSYVRKNVNEFIGTLLNVYIFLLLLAGSVAIAVANSITRPLVALGENLKKIKLGQRNTTLDWENQDEVGELIQNYNEMIMKLEDSAQVLALTERELAWREMAKQVAHEIKNPLTPMKLSIQHMQHAIRSRPEEVDNVVSRVSNTLIEQIDALSQIASEFSNFANMPKPENEKIILNEIVAGSHDLFRKREDMDISLYVPIDEIYVFADKSHLFRVLNNLIKNAIQAIPNTRRGKIDIRLYKDNDQAIIRVKDNGTGIPDEMKEKVFYPNFTTKNSGTGLGLAISANIIESFNGNIYFETVLNEGTDFYIELPLMHMKDNFEVKQRVAL